MSTPRELPPPHPVLTERLGEHLRAGDLEAFRKENACSAIMLDLLEALGWYGDRRRIIESLPHFEHHFDIGDLRQVIQTLGYDSDALEVQPRDLQPDLMPALFATDDGRMVVVAQGEQGATRYFDGDRWYEGTDDLDRVSGTTFVFTNTNASNPLNLAQAQLSWFSQIWHRYRTLATHLVATTVLLNVLAIAIPLFIMTVYDKIIGTRTTDALPYLVAGVVLVLGCELLLRQLRSKTLGLIAARLDYSVGTATFRRLLHLPPLLTERATLNSQLNQIKQFDAIRDFFTGANATTLLELPFAVVSVIIIAILAGWVAMIPAAMFLAYGLFAMFWAPRVKRQMGATGMARTARQQILMETVSGMRELKALGMERDWENRFRELSSSAITAGYRTSVNQSVIQTVAQTIMMLAGIGVLAAGAQGVMAGSITVGALIAIMALVWRVLGPLQGAFLAWMRVDQIGMGVRQINQLMKLSVEETDSSSSLLRPDIVGAVELERVSFRYSTDANPAVVGVSCSVKPGEFLVIVGENGSGKSTLIKLIAAMYRPQGGAVLIDGMDARQFNPVDLRRLVSYVPQKSTLFHGSIAQNMRLKDSMVTDADILAALEAAGIRGSVEQLPGGINYRIGDARTDRLPTALVHGLCLARAFLRDSPILLLDEPGSALDYEADRNLIRQLQRIKGHKTVIMVSHRPSHIKLADKALLVHEGVVVHAGRPADCLAVMNNRDERPRPGYSGPALVPTAV